MIAEPDVAITDWILAVEAAGLAWMLRRFAGPPGRAWALFFVSIAAAALLGGIAHGFLPEGRGLVAVAVWRATLLAIGVTAASGFVAGMLAISEGRRGVAWAAVAGWVGYALVVVLGTDAFAVAIAAYAPVTLFLLAVFVARWRGTSARPALIGAVGLLVLLAGSWVQWRRIALHPVYFTHNAVFHVIQMLALPLIHRGARGLLAGRSR